MPNNPFSRSGIGQPVPVQEPARRDQVVNSTGGFVFKIDDKTRLTRFLILGTAGGSYYATEKKLTKDNVNFLVDLIARDEQMVINTVLEISTSGRAFRNSPAIFAVAAIAVHGKKGIGSGVTDRLTNLVAKVCRTSTHLFEFAEYVEMLGGWSRAKRAAVANWYTQKSVSDLAFQLVKYRHRNGWTHQDMVRLSHPVGLDVGLAKYLRGEDTRPAASSWDLPDIIRGLRFAQEAQSVSELLSIALDEYNLPWEAIPTHFLTDLRVWQKIFYNGQLRAQALLRNVTRLAKLGAFNDLQFARDYATQLTNEEMIRRTKLHPFQYLLALQVHENGQLDRTRGIWGDTRTKSWTTSSIIRDALDAGFHSAFHFVEPANKRTMIALDVSGSMRASMTGTDLTACETVAAMSMVVARTEPLYQIMGFAHVFRDLGISASDNLASAMHKAQDNNFGSTNISLPFEHATQRKMEIDTFIVMTDNEVNTGGHPYQALQRYRDRMGIDARLVVVACTPTEFSVADPNDAGMLDISGADSNMPTLIAQFSAGRV